MSLPRELKLIIDDIASQNVHLLEWEVFGNAEEDMRIVLTWRYSDAKKNAKQFLTRRDSMGKWKLRQSSITLDDQNDHPLIKDSEQNEKENTLSKSEESSENSKQKNLTHSKSIEDESEKVNSKDTDEKKVKKKNPFRKVKKDEKAPKKGKLQLNLSMDGVDEHVGDDQLVVKPRSGSKSSKNSSNRNSLLDERILEQAEEYNKEQQKLEEEKRKLDEEENHKKLDKESEIQDDKKMQSYDDNQEYKLKGKDVPDDKDEKEKKEYKESGQDRRGSISAKQKRRGSKLEQLKKCLSFSGSIDENSSEKCAGYNHDQEHPGRKVESEAKASKVENLGNSTDDKISNQNEESKEIARLDDDITIQRQRQDGYDNNQEYSKCQGSVDSDEKSIVNDNKNLQETEGYDENEEYKKRTNENKIETTQGEKALNGDKNKKKSDLLKKAKNVAKLDDDDGIIHRKKRPGHDDNQEYSRCRGSDGIEHGDSIKEDNCDQLKKERDEQLRKEMIEKSRQEIAELQEIGQTQETIEFKNIKSEEAAQKMLILQREKYCMSIDETALDSLTSNFAPPSMSNETIDQNNEEKKSQDQIKPVSDDVNSSINKRRNAGDNVNQKNLKNEEARKKSLKKQKQIKLHENKDSISREDFPSMDELPTAKEITEKSGWRTCVDCRYNGFCDDAQHKKEYILILLADSKYNQFDSEACSCNVCTGGAVHNGCVYRELLRLKTDYKLFDKRNLCFCRVCLPFKYRKMCLRQELRLMRLEGKDIYYRLTYDGDDGKEGYHPPTNDDSDDSNYHSDNEYDIIDGEQEINAMCLDDLNIELTKEDKFDFRNCIDCQFNGFCDDIRHKKLYLMLLRIDDEDFDELEEDCGCLVCAFKGAAHSGCAEREIKRLRYDLLLFDKQNLCYCLECVPFKYRSICLRQEMKLLRRNRNINLYNKL